MEIRKKAIFLQVINNPIIYKFFKDFTSHRKKNSRVVVFSSRPFEIRIIASHFANCEVNFSYCDCKVVNHTKNAKQFCPKENLIHLDHTVPHYILILFIHWMLLLAEILLIVKITLQNAKNALQFLKKKLSPAAG